MKRQIKTTSQPKEVRAQKHDDLILKALDKAYPEPRSELNFVNEFELLVSVILSAQCTDKKVNQVTPTLFKKYPDVKKLSKAKLLDVETIIRPINYYRTKAKNIIATAATIDTEYAGALPKTHSELISLPGVGNKTANVVLGELGHDHTFPVDTHVLRVSNRLGFTNGKTPEQVEKDMRARFPKEMWRNLHHWLIFHGRRVCKAQRPLCKECVLNRLCPSADIN